MDFHQKWTKTRGSHDQIQIQIHKYKYKHTNTQIQIRTHKYKYKYRGVSEVKFWTLARKKSFHGNGHIPGTVGPTSLRHPSKRSSLPARPEKHLRGSLTCTGNTGEPVAPVLHIEFGSVWVRRPKNDQDRKGNFWVCYGLKSKLVDVPHKKSSIWHPGNHFWTLRSWVRHPRPWPTLSIHAKPALISGMDFHQKWTKTKRSHDQIQMRIHKYKYQIHKYKYKFAHSIQIQTQGGLHSQISTFGQQKKDFTKTAISLEPLDRHCFNTPQIEALGVPD